MPSFGLDISDESLKYMELTFVNGKFKVGKYGNKKIAPGIIQEGKIVDAEKFKDVLILLKKEVGIEAVRVSLLENQIYLFKITLEKAGLRSIRESIELSLEEHIPIPAQETIFDFEQITEDSRSIELQVAAIPVNVIEEYLSVLESAGISVNSFEIEAQAIARSIIKRGDMDTYLVVDFGEKRTGVFVVSRGIVMFTSTLDIGGVTLNNMIQKNFQISSEEADKMKKQHGLQRNAVDKELFSVLLNSVSILRDEIVRHLTYWNTHTNENDEKNPLIRKIILCGGDSNLIGLSDYFSVSMKTDVAMANVWINIANTEDNIPEIPYNQSLSYAAVIGLTLGDFDNS